MGDGYKWSSFSIPCLAAAEHCRKDGSKQGNNSIVEDLACHVDVTEYIESNYRSVKRS